MEGDLSWPLRRAAQLYGTSAAVDDGNRAVSYGELQRDVLGLASGLRRLGIEAGARVGYLGVNSLAHVECCIGVPAAGRVLVDLNFRLATPELAFMVTDCEVEAIVADSGQLEVARELRQRCPSVRTLIYDGPAPCPEDCLDYWQLVG
ncbi:MAG TPA: AMP-binding protein, partial [Solirubrobacteraceae bacterium]|nr:AMP-binding protein [Solirubrobacteraceae bacterium]